jgi:hypothetical protein
LSVSLRSTPLPPRSLKLTGPKPGAGRGALCIPNPPGLNAGWRRLGSWGGRGGRKACDCDCDWDLDDEEKRAEVAVRDDSAVPAFPAEPTLEKPSAPAPERRSGRSAAKFARCALGARHVRGAAGVGEGEGAGVGAVVDMRRSAEDDEEGCAVAGRRAAGRGRRRARGLGGILRGEREKMG